MGWSCILNTSSKCSLQLKKKKSWKKRPHLLCWPTTIPLLCWIRPLNMPVPLMTTSPWLDQGAKSVSFVDAEISQTSLQIVISIGHSRLCTFRLLWISDKLTSTTQYPAFYGQAQLCTVLFGLFPCASGTKLQRSHLWYDCNVWAVASNCAKHVFQGNRIVWPAVQRRTVPEMFFKEWFCGLVHLWHFYAS